MSEEKKTLVELIEELIIAESMETDEETESAFKDFLDDTVIAVNDKIDACLAIARRNVDLALAAKAEATRQTKRQKMFENKSKSIRGYVMDCMLFAKMKSLKTAYNTVSISSRKSKKIDYDVDALSKCYLRKEIVLVPNKELIAKDLADGKEIKGYSVKETETKYIKVR